MINHYNFNIELLMILIELAILTKIYLLGDQSNLEKLFNRVIIFRQFSTSSSK